MNATRVSIKREAEYVALLSLAEVGFGSLIHAIHLPLGGHLLSLNQALILSRSVLESESRRQRLVAARSVNRISTAGALMKSLSPAGKILTPMLALTVQGLLFSVGILFFGAGILGATVGAMLLSLWGFIQPVILAFLIYGKDLFQAFVWAWQKLASGVSIDPRSGPWILLSLVLLKILLSILVVPLSRLSFGRRFSEAFGNQGRRIVHRKANQQNRRPSVAAALRDLRSPIFLFSFLLTAAFVFFSRSSSHVTIFWTLLRPLAVGFIVFYLVRAFPARFLEKPLQRISPTMAVLLRESRASILDPVEPE